MDTLLVGPVDVEGEFPIGALTVLELGPGYRPVLLSSYCEGIGVVRLIYGFGEEDDPAVGVGASVEESVVVSGDRHFGVGDRLAVVVCDGDDVSFGDVELMDPGPLVFAEELQVLVPIFVIVDLSGLGAVG